MEEREGKDYHLKRFLEDVNKSSNKKNKEKKKSKTKKKQITLPTLSVNRGIFENVLLSKTCHRETYSPLQKARMNEDIFALAQNRPDQEDFSMMNINKIGENTEALKEKELIEQDKNSLPPCTAEQDIQHKNNEVSTERKNVEYNRREMTFLNDDCRNDKRFTKPEVQEEKEPSHVHSDSLNWLPDKQFEFLSNKTSFDVFNFDFLAKNSSSESDISDSHSLFRNKINHEIFHPEKNALKLKINHNRTDHHRSNSFLHNSFTLNKKFKYFNPHTFPASSKSHKKRYRLSPHTY